MELSPAQRKLAFAVIVLILAGLGAFLLWPASQPARGQAVYGTGPTARASSPAAPAAGAPAAGSPTPPAPAGSAVNIYRWLPFSQSDLAAAAGVVRRFCTGYTTWSYTESPASYVARMRGLVTPALAATLARGFATPGIAQLRTQQRQTASGSGAITALRAFGPSSLVFLVTVTQKTYSSQAAGGTPTAGVTSSDYAITIAQSGIGWQVNDIQLASAGNS
jgi:hypothetical protein